MKTLAPPELAVIAAIDATLLVEADPELAVLLHATRDAHQVVHEQIQELARLDNVYRLYRATGSDGRRGQVDAALARIAEKLDTLLTALLGGPLTLRILRLLEHHLAESYAEAQGASDGFAAGVFGRIAEGGRQRRCILAAHLAQTGDAARARELPYPLADYFATAERRTCMRCLLDRPGERAALQRSAPHAYVCRACHDETVAALPLELAAAYSRWSDRRREACVIERALSRSSQQTARDQVHAVLAGQAPRARKRRAYDLPVYDCHG